MSTFPINVVLESGIINEIDSLERKRIMLWAEKNDKPWGSFKFREFSAVPRLLSEFGEWLFLGTLFGLLVGFLFSEIINFLAGILGL